MVASERVRVGQVDVLGGGFERAPGGVAVGASERVRVGRVHVGVRRPQLPPVPQSSTGARVPRMRASGRLRVAGWSCCSGPMRTGARGTSGRGPPPTPVATRTSSSTGARVLSDGASPRRRFARARRRDRNREETTTTTDVRSIETRTTPATPSFRRATKTHRTAKHGGGGGRRSARGGVLVF